MKTERLSEAAVGAFKRQQDACAEMGSDFTALICRLVAERGLPTGIVANRLSNWPDINDNSGDAVPLRFAGALHRLVLEQTDDGLMNSYPPNLASEDEIFSALCIAVINHVDFIDEYLNSAPQTNEVGRSALLLPALLQLVHWSNKPISLFELGASAGLNQNLQHFHYDFGGWKWGNKDSSVQLKCEWRGAIPTVRVSEIEILSAKGCDLAPVDISTSREQKRFTSYVWPDQEERLERLAGAIKIASKHKPDVAKSNASDWLGAVLDMTDSGQHTVIMHTIMWQYMSVEEQARCEALIDAFGGRATPDSPVSWLRFESDGKAPGGLLSATNWDGRSGTGNYTELARADYHGKWINWA